MSHLAGKSGLLGIEVWFLAHMSMNRWPILALVFVFLLPGLGSCSEQPIESGTVVWGRDLQSALVES